FDRQSDLGLFDVVQNRLGSADGRFALRAQHGGQLADAAAPLQTRHVGRRAALIYRLAYVKVGIAIAGQLRQVGDDHDLVIGLGRQPPQLAADDIADAAADALIDFVKDQRRGAVNLGQRRLQGQHQARRFAATGDSRHRLERLAWIGRDEKLDPIDATLVKGKPLYVAVDGHVAAVGGGLSAKVDAEPRAVHPE